MLDCRERGYGDGSIPSAWLSSIALLPWLPGFPPQAFPTTISSLTSPRSVSLQSRATFTLGFLHNPFVLGPAAAPSRGPGDPSEVHMAMTRTVWFSFHLGCCRSADSLSALNVSPLSHTIAPVWGLDPCFSSHTRQRRDFPPSFFVLPSFV